MGSPSSARLFLDQEAVAILSDQTKSNGKIPLLFVWSRRRDLNPRPLGPEPSALPNCATPRPFRSVIITEDTALCKNISYLIP